MLLALAVMSTHPTPHSDILLPAMHPNIAGIARVWVAHTIITGNLSLPSWPSPEPGNISTHRPTRRSEPFNLLNWDPLNSTTPRPNNTIINLQSPTEISPLSSGKTAYKSKKPRPPMKRRPTISKTPCPTLFSIKDNRKTRRTRPKKLSLNDYMYPK
jgi:hypothetical protein